MYAVIVTGGKQYKVTEGEIFSVEKLDAAAGDTLTLDQVLMVNDGSGVKIGSPLLEGAKVTVQVIEQGRGKKLTIFKYKRRKNERKKQGHRQAYTKLKVEKIEA